MSERRADWLSGPPLPHNPASPASNPRGTGYNPALYDRHYYQRVAAWAQSEKYRAELDTLFNGRQLVPEDLVLDIGCGSGEAARYVRQRYGCEAVGIDFPSAWPTPPNLSRLARANATALPFCDSTFTQVILVHVLGHLPQPVAVLREAHRVLRPGGTCGMITPNRNFVFCYRPWNRIGLSYVPDATVLRFYSARELGEDFRRAGFAHPVVTRAGKLPFGSERWLRPLGISLPGLRERLFAAATKESEGSEDAE